MQTEVRSWSESLAFTPEQRVLAASEQEVVAAVTSARGRGRSIRPVGSLHSSTPIIATDDTMLDMRGMHGVTWHDADHRLAHVLPGTGLAEAGVQLHAAGLSMPNLGDVDYQSISGAIGTGTHGTGLTLPNLSAMLVGGVLITADGGRLPFGVDAGDSEESDLLRAARVGLGTLGVLTSLTLRLVPAFDLRVQKHMTRIDWVLENFEELAAGSRHVDFYWYPRSDVAQLRIMDEPDRDAALRVPGRVKSETVGPVHEVIPNDRHLKFNEMEYLLPLEQGLDAFRAARQRIRQRHRRTVAWRVLVRTIAADDAMLSPSAGRTSMSIALLHNHSLPYREYFADMEPLLREHGGRPHWGKHHWLRAHDLAPLYPDWQKFGDIRRRLDPAGTFLTPYLRELLEDEHD